MDATPSGRTFVLLARYVLYLEIKMRNVRLESAGRNAASRCFVRAKRGGFLLNEVEKTNGEAF
jgi:hypothetical protein